MTLYFVDEPYDKHLTKSKFNTYKEAFLKPDQHDMKILVTMFRFLKYFVMTPFNLEQENYAKFGKYFAILLSLLCLVYCYFSIAFVKELVKDSPVTRFLITALWSIMNMLFLISCFLNSNTFKKENWKTALKSLDQVEIVLRKLTFNAPKSNFRLVLQIILIFVTYFTLLAFQVYMWVNLEDTKQIISYIGTYITYFYMCVFLLFILRLSEFLKIRYNFVNETLKKIMINNVKEHEKVKKLDEIVYLYKTFKILMDNINSIFGPHLFFYVSVSVCYILCSFSNNMDVSAGDTTEKTTSILSIAVTIVYTLSLVVLIVTCDSVETSGNKVIKTCYLLHESSDSQLVKENLLQMAQYAEQWKPTFCAAGFYTVNQSTLSAIFEAIITYLVIIIQFNLALAV